MWFFFDTSALVKRYHEEKGTGCVDRIFDTILSGRHRGTVSSLAILELVSAIRRKVASGELDDKDFIDASAYFMEEVSGSFLVIPIDSVLHLDALDMVVKHALRASDSIQLACALKLAQTVEKSEICLVNCDQELSSAAAKEGFRIIDPQAAAMQDLNEVLK